MLTCISIALKAWGQQVLERAMDMLYAEKLVSVIRVCFVMSDRCDRRRSRPLPQ